LGVLRGASEAVIPGLGDAGRALGRPAGSSQGRHRGDGQGGGAARMIYQKGRIDMARTPSFNFGANRKPKKAKAGKGKGRKGKGGGKRSNAWRAYAGSNAPIPD